MLRFIRMFLLLLLLFPAHGSTLAEHQSPSTVPTSIYLDSAGGLLLQFQDLLQSARSNDQGALQAALDSFAIPDANAWIARHFDAAYVLQLAADYSKAFAGIRSHIWWATGTFAKYSDFSYNVVPSELPKPLAEIGFESLLPHPSGRINIENFRISSTSSDPKHGPPSWVSSFVFIDGRFRWVGGTYPFWVEGLNALRGPMSLPPAVVHGRAVQAIAFRNDKKVPGIDGIVQLEIKVEHDGHVSKIKVLSGDESFIEDAKSM